MPRPQFVYPGPVLPEGAAALPEHRVLLACGRALLAGERGGDPALLAGVDPGRLHALAGPHGLVPLLNRWLAGFRPAGTELRAALRGEVLSGSQSALRLAAELAGLMRGLEAAGVPVLAYKGPALALQVYGDASLRRFADLDLVVAPAALERAIGALRGLGLAEEPFASPAQRAALIRDGHHLSLHGRSAVVELHWRFGKRAFGFREALDGVWERRETLTLAGAAVPVLGRGDHLLALAIHASKGVWSSLEWTLSLAVLARDLPEGEWAAVAARARAWGCVRALQVGLLVSEELFSTPAPASAWAHLPPPPAARRLARGVAARVLAGSTSPSAYFGTQLALRPGVIPKLRFVLRSLFVATPDDWAVEGARRRPGLARLVRPLRLLRKYGAQKTG